MPGIREGSLREIIDICNSICKESGSEEQPTDICHSSSLSLKPSIPDLRLLKEGLLRSCISESAKGKLIVLCSSAHAEFRKVAYAKLDTHSAGSSLLPDRHKYIGLLNLILEKECEQYSAKCQETILEMVRSAVNVFNSVNDITIPTASSSSEENEISRGHSKLATTILEKAFERSSNITVPERDKLALATQLKPKQVTIWYQNRRNRKTPGEARNPHADENEVRLDVVLSTKRKRAALYGDEPRMPSQHKRHCFSSSSATDSLHSKDAWEDRVYSSSHSAFSSSGSSTRSCNGTRSTATPDTSVDSQYTKDTNMKALGASDGRLHLNENGVEYIFDSSGQARLDFEDLELDLTSIETQLAQITATPRASKSFEQRQSDSESGVTPKIATFYSHSFEEMFPGLFEGLVGCGLLEAEPDPHLVSKETATAPDEMQLSQPKVQCPEQSHYLVLTDRDTPSSTDISPTLDSSSVYELPSHEVFSFDSTALHVSDIIEENNETFYGKNLFDQFTQHDTPVFQPFHSDITPFVDEHWT